MNFCQKHQNHHCIHSHNCTNHEHKKCIKNNTKNKKSQSIPSILCRNNKQLKKIVEINQQQSECNFNSNNKILDINKNCQNCKKLNLTIQQKNIQILQLKKSSMDFQKKYRQITQQNKQFQGVIEYYRNQMDRIVKCGEADIKNQIKRHIKQNSELSVRNRFLLNRFNQIQKQLEQYQKIADQNKKIIFILREQKDKITVAYNTLLEKYNSIKNQQGFKTQQFENQKKKTSKTQQKNQIIIKQTSIMLQSLKKQNNKLLNENKQLKSKLEILNQKLINQAKLSKMQEDSSKQRQVILKKNVQNYQKQIKDLKSSISKLQHSLKMKEEQLTLSKKIIQKQLNLNKENKQLFEHINKNQNKEQKQNNNKGNYNRGNKENEEKYMQQNQKNYSGVIEQLKKQVKSLKQKLLVYENGNKNKNPSIQTIQEYILTIGASQAFKKIIQQKNQYIKKLIRQKQTLLQKIT